MQDRWNNMTLGERIVLSAWIATREHLRADEDLLKNIRSRRVHSVKQRWELVDEATSPDEFGDEESVEGHVREGAD